jgi:hypothetical protein
VSATRLFIAIVVAGFGLSGCAAIGLTGAALGASAFSAGAGAAVDAGKEYTRGGAVYRTFSVPLSTLRLAVSDALERLELAVVTDEMDGVDRVVTARAREREVRIRLEPVTRTMTRLRLVVEEGMFSKDRATADEIVVQTEHSVGVAQRPVSPAARGTGASSLARGARR